MSDSIAPLGSRRNVLVSTAALFVVIWGLKEGEPLLVPLVFATFLAMLSAPAVLGLQARGLPDVIGVPLVVVSILAALFGFGALVGSSVNRFVATLPQYRSQLDEAMSSWFVALEPIGLSRESLKRVADPDAVLELAGTTLRGLASSLSDALLIVLTVAFMLLEVAGLPRKLRRALGNPSADLSELAKISKDVKDYVVLKTYISAGTGVALGLFTAAVGLDFALLWGVLAFLLNYVPNIGSILAAISPCLLATVQYGFSRGLVVVAGYVAVNLVFGNAIEPRVMGRKLGLSTLVVWLSLIFWGWLWGPIGMLLSVPLTMVVKILFEHSVQFRMVAALMDSPQQEL